MGPVRLMWVAPTGHRRLVLVLVNMHAGVREVGQPTGVVAVQVRRQHMTYVPRGVAEPGDLAYRGLLRVERRPDPAAVAHSRQRLQPLAVDRLDALRFQLP
jgi:hypothetical protein